MKKPASIKILSAEVNTRQNGRGQHRRDFIPALNFLFNERT
jgi:hypothetical protein